MIKVNAILTNKGTLRPASTPNTKFGSHCDGDFFYFFESKEECKLFHDSLPVLPQASVKSEFMELLEKATDEDLDFLAKKLKDKLK